MGWTINFVSLNGTACRAEINGGGTQILGAANPVTIEEDDSEDLLEVVRYKTGYLNVVEETNGQLDGLIPTTNTSHKVKIWYGTDLIFVGFMQAQTFENTWESAPRQMSFPIMSPLGLLADTKMNMYNPPREVALSELMADVVDALNGMGAEYDTVVWPKLASTTLGNLLNNTISSLVYCPFNEQHDASLASFNDGLFEPLNCQNFIEGFCNAFGLIVHDTPTGIVFSKFDHITDYLKCTAANLRTLTNVTTDTVSGGTESALTDRATPSDNDGRDSIVMPYEEVKVEYEGEYVESAELDFKHLTYNSQREYSNMRAAWLESHTPELTGEHLLANNLFNSANGRLTLAGANACSFGNVSKQTEGILVNLPDSTLLGVKLFTVNFYNRPTGGDIRLTFGVQWGNTIADLGNENIPHKTIGVVVKVGDLYYHGQGSWTTTQPNPSAFILDGQFTWNITNVPDGMPIEFSFYDSTDPLVSDPVQLIALTDIRLEEIPSLYSKYLVYKRDYDIFRVANGNGIGTQSVSRSISTNRKNSNQIGHTIVDGITTYRYMLISQRRLQIQFKRTDTMPYWMYMCYMAFMSQQWRVISISQYPWDDYVVITMHRSNES